MEKLKKCPFCRSKEEVLSEMIPPKKYVKHEDDCYIQLLINNRDGENTSLQEKLFHSDQAWNTRQPFCLWCTDPGTGTLHGCNSFADGKIKFPRDCKECDLFNRSFLT